MTRLGDEKTESFVAPFLLVKRTGYVGGYIIALLGVLILNYSLLRSLPGNLSTVIGADVMTRIPLTNPENHVGVSVLSFLAYLQRVLKGDWGVSFFYHQPVIKVIFRFLPWSLILGALSMATASLLGIILGAEAAGRKGGLFDRIASGGAVVFLSIPGYLLAILLLVIFSVVFHVFPLSGGIQPFQDSGGLSFLIDYLRHLFLPWVTLTLVMFPEYYLLMRSGMMLSLKQPFILTARSKGLRERVIRYRHAARDALIPILTRLGLQMGSLITGIIFVEVVFSYPGVGALAYESLKQRDVLLMDGILLIGAIWVVLMNLASDILLRYLDPRTRQETAR